MNEGQIQRLRRFSVLALCTVFPVLCYAQVYKCTENGSTTFQAEPCKGAGKLMHLEAGPTEQAMQDARDRADKDRAASAASTKSAKALSHGLTSTPPDCEKLNKAVTDAQTASNEISHAAFMGQGTQRNLNRLSQDSQQQLNSATQSATVSGCRQ